MKEKNVLTHVSSKFLFCFFDVPYTQFGILSWFRHEIDFLILMVGMIKEEDQKISIFTNENSISMLSADSTAFIAIV